MNSPEATVILKSPDGQWTSIGTEVSRGIVPEGLTLTANEFGPDTCSFSLRREASMQCPDLLAFNQADVLIGGQLVWGGRIWEAPVSDGDEDVIAVQGRGWQYHLDDDQIDRFWVKATLGEYFDVRNVESVPIATWYPGATITGETNGAVTLRLAEGGLPANAMVGIYLDLGPNRDPGYIHINYQLTTLAGTDIHFRAQCMSDWGGSPTGSIAIDDTFPGLGAGPSTMSGTFSTGARYILLWVFYVGLGGTLAAGNSLWLKLNRVKLYSDAAYDDGAGNSILKASDVARDVLASGALPLLDPTTSQIGTTAFSIPEFYPSGYQTPRSLIAAANAFEGNLFGVDAERRLFLRERDEVPLVEVGSWPGCSFQDASTNSGDGLYNKVIVQGTGAAGDVISEARTATVGLLNRQGFTRTATLSVDAIIGATHAQELGDVWLAEKSTPPFKGSLILSGWGGARYINGGDVHPSEFLLRYGQRIRLGQLVDPATGDQGRDGIIKSVSYAHDTETASLELDSERGRLETLLSRLSVVTSQIR